MRKKFDLQYYLEHPETRVVTRDGRDVRILCTDLRGKDYPIAATCISLSGYGDDVDTFTNEGKVVANASSEHTRDLFFDLPDLPNPAKKKVALTYEDMLERVKAGKTMWIVIDTTDINKVYTRHISNFGCNGVYYVFEFEIMFLSYQKLIEYQIHFVDGDPCWKEVEE